MNKLIYFFSDTCGPCLQMAPIIQQLRSSGVTVESINASSNSDLAMDYGVMSVPTIIKTDMSGRDLGRLTGFVTFNILMSFYKG